MSASLQQLKHKNDQSTYLEYENRSLKATNLNLLDKLSQSLTLLAALKQELDDSCLEEDSLIEELLTENA